MGTQPRLPNVTLVAGITLGMALGLIVAFIPPSRHVKPFQYVWWLALEIFRKPVVVQAVMGAAAAAHLIESVWTHRICQVNKVPSHHARGWIAMTWWMGYPAIHMLKRGLRDCR